MQESPRLLLFLSVDVIGSTAYKNKNREFDGIQPWLRFFIDFYQEFPEFFDKVTQHQLPETPRPEVWKSAGDELIFVVQLNCHIQALKVLMAFQLAIKQYDREIKKKSLPLGLKGCAWVAGFPVINAEVRPNSQTSIPDYIGPLIDTGFRLAKFADARKLVISLELALLVSKGLLDEPSSYNPQFFYDGKHVLKGVLSERPYPIIWIDMFPGQPFEDENLLGRLRLPTQPGQLVDFCKQTILAAHPELVIPYIKGCPEFSTIDPHHLRILENRGFDPLELLTFGTEPAGGVTLPDIAEPEIKEKS